jgi:alpha-ketoglutaric semialdehyde dehydrogenase
VSSAPDLLPPRARDEARTVRSVNPADPSDVVVEHPAYTVDDAREAVRAAEQATAAWATTPPARRARALTAVADALEERSEEVAQLVTREEGKPLGASRGEVGKTAEQFRFSAQLAYMVEGTVYPEEATGRLAWTIRAPLGVVVAVTPWNFPISLAARKIAPALAAGNTVVLKPSGETAAVGQLLVDLCHDAGVPADVLRVVHGADPDAMAALVGDPAVRALSFTGSDAVGEVLRRTAHPRARLQFELGGHNAAVVCADADLEQAAREVAAGAYGLTGQACTSTDRVLVDRAAHDALVPLLVAEVEKLQVGPGDRAETTVAPVATRAQHERLTALVDSAAADGAQVLARAGRLPDLDPDGFWVDPVLLADVPADHPVVTGEVFGPVLTVVPVDSLDDATTRVNASAHGLVTAVHTRDFAAAHRFARDVGCGLVKINERTTGNGVAPPFGGWKESSAGAFPEGGRQALDFVTDTKTVYAAY